jgi:hypothetical protein
MGTDLSWVKALGGGLTGNTGPISVLTFVFWHSSPLRALPYMKTEYIVKNYHVKKTRKLGSHTEPNSYHKKKRQNKSIDPGCWEGAVDAPPSQYP